MFGATYAVTVRDAAFERLKGITIFGQAFRSVRKAPMISVEAGQIPALGVFIVGEDENPDGDDNVSIPRFINDLTLGISVVSQASSTLAQDGKLDLAVATIKDLLLCDPTFVSMVEGVKRTRRKYEFFKDGETYYAEFRLEIVVYFRTQYPPPSGVPLTSIYVTAEPFGSGGTTLEEQFELPQ